MSLLDLALPPTWTRDALCPQTDPEEFFPEKGGSTRAAKAVCARCPVTDQCLEYAIQHGERFGIWGGTSERERRRLLEQIPIDTTADDTWFNAGDDFTYDLDLGATA